MHPLPHPRLDESGRVDWAGLLSVLSLMIGRRVAVRVYGGDGQPLAILGGVFARSFDPLPGDSLYLDIEGALVRVAAGPARCWVESGGSPRLFVELAGDEGERTELDSELGEEELLAWRRL